MATLVLTAVGTALGGPIGGALGGLLGAGIDARVFRPAAREGPRLKELGVQTSSYGTQIPRLYGIMRVAGTVIWSTDLIESRNRTGGGKGRPATTSYSYAASFAVLLSARAIRGVRRVWAEGQLIRGAAGDWKVHTGFRLHTGDEDQDPDPLIASTEGACPAYRGSAYAVFEGLDLTDFGNRIPSLTFEVIADEGALDAAAIARDVAPEVVGETRTALAGFAAAGGNVAAVLETLGAMSGAWFAPVGERIAMRDAAGDVVELADEGFGAKDSDARRLRAVAAADSAPCAVVLSHYDPARDYQTGVQRARRPGPGRREERIEAPAVLSADAAKALAEAMLVRAEDARVRRTVLGGFAGLPLGPGDCVRIAGEAGVWRIARAGVEAMATKLELVPLTHAPIAAAGSSGRVLASPDRIVGRTMLHAVELPPPGDTLLTAPRLTVLAAGDGAGWRGAGVLYSLDDGANWIEAGGIARAATMGTIEQPLRPASALLEDRASTMVVRLAHAEMMLGDADAAALDRGANLAVVGGELLQFAHAEPLGGARWRLAGFRRGLRGTDGAALSPVAGAGFALVESDVALSIDLPASAIGRSVRLLASGVGDTSGPVATTAYVGGVSVLPPSPTHLTADRVAGSRLALRWTRRSRLGWQWRDGVDAPLGEERESYVVMLSDADGVRATLTTDEPRAMLTDVPAGDCIVSVRQLATLGLSSPTTINVKGM